MMSSGYSYSGSSGASPSSSLWLTLAPAQRRLHRLMAEAVYQGSYGSVHVIAGSGDGKTQLLQHLIAPNGITRPCGR
jgi:hypothetical protein